MTSASATTRAPVNSGKNLPIQLPRPPQPTMPTSTVEFAWEPKTVWGLRMRIPPAAWRKVRRGCMAMASGGHNIAGKATSIAEGADCLELLLHGHIEPQFFHEPLAHVAEPGIIVAAVEIDLGERDGAVVAGDGLGFAVGVEDERVIAVSGADEEDVILDGARLGQSLIAVPDGHENHLSALQGEGAGGIGVLHVPADHDADLAEISAKNGVGVAGGEAGFDFLARQVDLAILAGKAAFAIDQNGRVIDGGGFALVDAGDDVGVLAPGELAEFLRGRTGNGFGDVGVALAGAGDGHAFG